jgi:succinate-semialdehyde dehydrogenase/glutarate-semialdehyde dehydrogenase
MDDLRHPATDLASRLSDPGLLATKAYLAGRWVDGGAGTLAVDNPARGDVIAEVADCTPDDAARAIDAAAEAQRIWAARTAKDRAGVLRRWFDVMMEHQDDLATILTAEQGKPLAEARGEIAYGAAFVEFFAEEAKRIRGEILPGHMENLRLQVIRQPVGVVASITPWNFPNAMITRKAAPALAAGCAFVARPASETPLSALALGVLAERAGLPEGVLSILPSSDASGMGKAFCSHPKVRKLTFTGSTPVGRTLLAQASEQVLRVSMELGGLAPFIVFDDADLDAAVAGAIACKYRNNGQTCVCANRIYVQSGIHDAFVERFAAKVAEMTVGDGLEGADLGPLIGPKAVEKVERHVSDAVEKGGEVVLGGRRSDVGPLFYEPTVVTGATDAMLCAGEETFGPIAPIFRFDEEADAVARANDTIFGLAAYFYAREVGRITRVSEGLEYGIVGVNTGIISTEVAPFGGVKQSGLGREGSHLGIDEFLEPKYVCLAI